MREKWKRRHQEKIFIGGVEGNYIVRDHLQAECHSLKVVNFSSALSWQVTDQSEFENQRGEFAI